LRPLAIVVLGSAFISLVLPGGVRARTMDLVAPTVTASCSPGGGCEGWFTSDVNVSFAWAVPTGESFWSEDGCNGFSVTTDTTGLPYSCTVTVTPDGGTTKVSSKISGAIKRDATPPTISSFASQRPPDSNGWYNRPVTISASGTDATSGIASCTSTTYTGPDTSGTTVTGTCRDAAGNVSAPMSLALKYDATPPSVNATPGRAPDANGWYNHPVAIAFSGSDATAGLDSCTSTTYSGPDTSGTTLSGSCSDKAGNSAGSSMSIQYDATPPTVTAVLDRPPDANGWYNHPVTLKASGTDAGSGIATCTGGTYGGAADATATLTGTCTDAAGNAASQTVSFKYDGTPPKLTGLTAIAGNGTTTLRWSASADTASVTVARLSSVKGSANTIVYKGDGRSYTDSKVTNGVRYRYTVTAVDAAGNKTSLQKLVEPRALLKPALGAKLSAPPLLAWSKLAGTSYYNVQIFFQGHKVLSLWPVTTKLPLTRTWTYNGVKFTLKKGRYRWYVWPGYGPRSASKYGKLLGGSLFYVD